MELAGFGNNSTHVVERGRWMDAEPLKGPFTKGVYAIGQYPNPLENVPGEILLKAQKDFEAEVDIFCLCAKAIVDRITIVERIRGIACSTAGPTAMYVK